MRLIFLDHLGSIRSLAVGVHEDDLDEFRRPESFGRGSLQGRRAEKRERESAIDSAVDGDPISANGRGVEARTRVQKRE